MLLTSTLASVPRGITGSSPRFPHDARCVSCHRRCAMPQKMRKDQDQHQREVLEFDHGVAAYPPGESGGYWRIRWEESRRRRDTTAKSRSAASAKATEIVERLARSTPTELGRARGADLRRRRGMPPTPHLRKTNSGTVQVRRPITLDGLTHIRCQRRVHERHRDMLDHATRDLRRVVSRAHRTRSRRSGARQVGAIPVSATCQPLQWSRSSAENSSPQRGRRTTTRVQPGATTRPRRRSLRSRPRGCRRPRALRWQPSARV